MRPGTNQAIQSQSPSQAAPVDFSSWLIAGITTQGPIAPQAATSLAQWQSIYGGRGTSPIMSDSVEAFFNQGGTQVWTARVVGPSAVFASIALTPSSLTATAIGPGAYANGYKIVVTYTAGSPNTYTITVEDSNSNVLETSPVLVTTADAVAYGQTSAYVTISSAGTTAPVSTATFTLAAGADDLTDITTTQYTNAGTQFLNGSNPLIPTAGIMSFPGQTSSANVEALTILVAGTPYVAYADMADAVSSAATLTSNAAPYTAQGTAARQLGLFAPWLDQLPVAGSTGLRGTPPSAFAAGCKSALINSTGNPNLAAAGARGTLIGVAGAHETWNASDRQTLNTAGINVIRPTAGGFQIYGNVTAVNRQTDPLYFMLTNSHLDGAISAQADAIQETFVFSEIDGLGTDLADFVAELVGMMTDWWNLGALYGPDGTAATAFAVTPAETPTLASEGILLATIDYARSPSAEQVNLDIVRSSAATGV